MTLAHPKYRADVDGLRAVAVLSVVGFHLFPHAVRGGFIGVDIFFVISGFLISSIIFDNLDRGSFSLAEFYARRIRRIFPSLLLVLAACLAFGWFLLLADEYAELGKHTAAGAAFISNILLWRESGYFDAAAETKPLLHLWSLGIEEQFYIVWPLLLWVAWKCRWNRLYVTLGLACLSFFLSIKGLRKDAEAMFYLPHVRFWELLAGALLAQYKNPVPGHARSLLGAALVAAGLLLIHKGAAFPGFWVLLPVAGAALLISAGPQGAVNRRILSHPVLVWFGLISYPLYLWHWPLLSFVRIASGGAAPSSLQIAAVLLSILPAWITYRFIEKPIRADGHYARKRNLLLIAMTVIGGSGYLVYMQQGFPLRALPRALAPHTESIAVTPRSEECFEIPYAYKKDAGWFCSLGDARARPMLFAYGDSHALSLIPALEKLAGERGRDVLFTGNSGCPPLLGIQSIRGGSWTEKYDCQALNERIFTHVRDARIPAVLLVARWSYYTGGTTRPEEFNAISMDVQQAPTREFSQASLAYGIEQTVARYRAIGVKTYFIEDNPQQLHGPQEALRRARLPSDVLINDFSLSQAEHEENQRLAAGILHRSARGAAFIDFNDLLCENGICPLVKNGKFLYSDADHLSVAGALYIYPRLNEAFKSH